MRRSAVIRLLNLLLSIVLLISALPAASADDSASSSEETEAGAEEYPYTLDGKTWDELAEEFIAKYSPNGDQIGLGYYNTVTGETHYYEGDKYFIAASLYKLPLCMHFQQAINTGVYSADDFIYNYKLGELIRGSIVDSNNDYAHALLKTFKEPRGFRKTIAQYVGVDVEAMPDESQYWSNTFFNARQIISCLRSLYDNPEDFQIIMDYMRQAEPEKYFNYHQQSVPIAHKYGYVTEFNCLFVNDCGICYTDDPILIVIFTRSVRQYTEALPEYCTLMIDYANVSREQRLEAEAREEAERIAEEQRLAEEERFAEEERRAEEQRLAEEAKASQEEASGVSTAIAGFDITSPGRRIVILSLTIAAGVLLIVFILSRFKHLKCR